jgi:hypothetical protein
LLQAVADGGDGHLVQLTGGFLAVPRDEGHGGPAFKQRGRGVHLLAAHAQFSGHRRVMIHVHL